MCYISHIESELHETRSYSFVYTIRPENYLDPTDFEFPYFTNSVTRNFPEEPECGPIIYNFDKTYTGDQPSPYSSLFLNNDGTTSDYESTEIQFDDGTGIQFLRINAPKMHNLHNLIYNLELTVSMQNYADVPHFITKVVIKFESVCADTSITLIATENDHSFRKNWFFDDLKLTIMYQIGDGDAGLIKEINMSDVVS